MAKGSIARCSVALPVLLAAVASPAAASADDAWPTIPIPAGVRTFIVGDDVVVNGLPMRLRTFVSSQPPRAIAAEFKRSIGGKVVESALGGKIILGRPDGDYYLVVQIESTAEGSRGVVGVSRLRAAAERAEDTVSANQRWMSKMPPGSQLLSRVESQDRGRLSRHMVVSNRLGLEMNRDRLVDALGDEGLALERESAPNEPVQATRGASPVEGRMYFFRGARKEAVATVHREGDGQTTVVVNVVTSLEPGR